MEPNSWWPSGGPSTIRASWASRYRNFSTNSASLAQGVSTRTLRVSLSAVKSLSPKLGVDGRLGGLVTCEGLRDWCFACTATEHKTRNRGEPGSASLENPAGHRCTKAGAPARTGNGQSTNVLRRPNFAVSSEPLPGHHQYVRSRRTSKQVRTKILMSKPSDQ